MADNKLRLDIVTALDNAGLKATKEQLDGLEKTLRKTNSTGVGKLSNGLTKLPGKLGDVISGFGQVGSAIGAVYLSWKTFQEGLKIGQAIFKQFGDGASYTLESVGNGFKSLYDNIIQGATKLLTGTNDREAAEQMNKVALDNIERQVKKVEYASNKKIELMDKEIRKSDQVVDAINRQTRAYTSQAQTLQNLKDAQGDARVVQLERQKFEEKLRYEAAGQYDAAEQIGKAYDVEIEFQKGVQKLEGFEVKIREQQQQLRAAVAVRDQKAVAAEIAQKALDEAKDKINGLQNGRAVTLAQRKLWQKSVDRATRERDKALADFYDAEQRAYAIEGTIGQLQVTAGNAAERGRLAVDRAAWEYDKFTEQNGNPGNFAFAKEYWDKINDNSKAYEYQRRTAEASEGLAQKLEELLRAKEN